MSSYLNIYAVPKESDKKLLLFSYSRSHPTYQAFYEYGGIAYAGIENKYTKVTLSMMEDITADAYKEMYDTKSKIAEYEKYAAGNTDIIQDIISTKEYYNELQENYYRLCIIKEMVYDIEKIDCTDFQGIYVNID